MSVGACVNTLHKCECKIEAPTPVSARSAEIATMKATLRGGWRRLAKFAGMAAIALLTAQAALAQSAPESAGGEANLKLPDLS